MARTAARGLSFGTLKEQAMEWAGTHREEIRVGLAAAAAMFLFAHGLPLWDDDYGQWLAQAQGGFFELLKRLILPVTSEPATWGYSDRPMQVLIYRILSLFFGTWGTGYFFVKCLAFGALSGTMYHWMRRQGVERMIACLVLALFVLSTNVLASILWHSDFTAYSQLALALILFLSLDQIQKGPTGLQVYKKGYAGLPAQFKRFVIAFFLAVYFGAKLRGDIRLAPLILLTYLYIYRRERFKVYAAPMGVTFLATLPWSAQMFKHLPPFVPGAAGYQGWTFNGFSIGRMFEFLVGDAFVLKTAPLSVIGGAGIVFVLALAVYGSFRLYQERVEAPNEKWGLLLVWFGFMLVACGMLARQNPAFQLRYTFMPLVPATLLFAYAAQAAYKEFSRLEWFRYAVYGVVALQCGIHLFHDYQYRRDLGRTIVAVDKLYDLMEKQHANAQLLLGPGFRPYAFRKSDSYAISNRKEIQGVDEARDFQPGLAYVAQWTSTLDARFAVDTVATGCGSSLFDAIFSCNPNEGAVLLKWIGQPSELAQADQLQKQGNVAGARQALDAYLVREPSNHGAQFMAGLLAYQQGDHARMEKAYDAIGPHFQGHPSVMYNWGLSKQGVQKFAEASKLLEKAYAMAPRDYAIGFNLADTYYRQGKKARALATVDDLLRVYPGNEPLKNAYNSWSK